MKKRLFSLLLCLCMTLTLVPATVWAAESDDNENPPEASASAPVEVKKPASSDEALTEPAEPDSDTTFVGNDSIPVDSTPTSNSESVPDSMSELEPESTPVDTASEPKPEPTPEPVTLASEDDVPTAQADDNIVDSGTCGAESYGENITWTLYKTGALTLSGERNMRSYNEAPWYKYRDAIRTVHIAKGITSIGNRAFSGCSSLTSVSIPASVTEIRYKAFEGCSSLTSVSVPASVTEIGENAFSGCNSLTSAGLIGSGCNIEFGWTEMIPAGVFSSFSGLTSVTIPSSVTSIGNRAFSGCSGLTSVTIPDSVTSIGYNAFSGCNNLTSAGPTGSGYDYEFDWAEAIPEHAFEGCSGLTSVSIPASVTEIGNGAFSGCSSLTNILVDTGNTAYSSDAQGLLFNQDKTKLIRCPGGKITVAIPDSVTSIGGGAFSGCSRLTNVSIPDSVTSISFGAFSGCSGLTSVTIPNSVTSIGMDTFGGCSSLTSVTISKGVKSIGESAFSGCSGLTSVAIPNSVTSIGRYAFSDCKELTSVTIPTSVTFINPTAFSGCKKLADVYYAGTPGQWSWMVHNSGGFQIFSKGTIIHCNSKEPEPNLDNIFVSGSLKDTGAVSVGASTGTVTLKIPETVPNAQAPIQNILCAFSDSSDASGPADEYKTGSVAEQGQTVQITPDDKNYRTVKIFTLDDQYRPVCKPTIITIPASN